MTDLNLVLLGPPGAGKGTQAERLREDLDLCHLATGDLLRRHRAEDTELGRRAAAYMDAGGLVPDELVVTMLLDALPEDVQDGRRGFLLDGFPRTIAQVYHEATVPLVDYYEALGLLRRVDGILTPDAVAASIRTALAASAF
jgi:adenylate kinase family enzyme